VKGISICIIIQEIVEIAAAATIQKMIFASRITATNRWCSTLNAQLKKTKIFAQQCGLAKTYNLH